MSDERRYTPPSDTHTAETAGFGRAHDELIATFGVPPEELHGRESTNRVQWAPILTASIGPRDTNWDVLHRPPTTKGHTP